MPNVVYNQMIWDTLYSGIRNPYGTAALMGNLFAESSLNPFCITGSKAKDTTGQLYTNDVDALIISKEEFIHDGIAYGLAQWYYYGRKENLYNFAKANFMSIGSTELQCLFLLKELPTYKTVWNTITTAKTIKEASDIILERYEKPATITDRVKALRASYGQAYFEKYSKQPSPTPTPGPKKKYVVTTADRVFIRSGNGTQYTKVKRIERAGTEFEYVATSNDGWHAFAYPKNCCVYWVSGDYSKVIER